MIVRFYNRRGQPADCAALRGSGVSDSLARKKFEERCRFLKGSAPRRHIGKYGLLCAGSDVGWSSVGAAAAAFTADRAAAGGGKGAAEDCVEARAGVRDSVVERAA